MYILERWKGSRDDRSEYRLWFLSCLINQSIVFCHTCNAYIKLGRHGKNKGSRARKEEYRQLIDPAGNYTRSMLRIPRRDIIVSNADIIRHTVVGQSNVITSSITDLTNAEHLSSAKSRWTKEIALNDVDIKWKIHFYYVIIILFIIVTVSNLYLIIYTRLVIIYTERNIL